MRGSVYDAIAQNQHIHFDFFCRCLKSLQTGVDRSDVQQNKFLFLA